MLDGLDEISNTNKRIAACEWIDRNIAGREKLFAVVTSRATGYRKGEGIEIKSDKVRADIMDLTDKQQEIFLQQWYKAAFKREFRDALSESDSHKKKEIEINVNAKKRADAIIEFLSKDENEKLKKFAKVPLLLQIMAVLWKDRDYLPDSKAQLYQSALGYLLDYRDREKKIVPLLPADKAQHVLSPIAYWMQTTKREDNAPTDEAPKNEVIEKLQEGLSTQPNAPSKEAFFEYLVDRAGLLVEYGEHDYIFRHKSFREYLVAYYMQSDRQYEYLDTLVENFGDDWWSEPLRFFISQVNENVFDAFLKKLFESQKSAVLEQKQQDLLEQIIEEAFATKIDALKNKLLNSTTDFNRQRYILIAFKAMLKRKTNNNVVLDVLENFITEDDAKGDNKSYAQNILYNERNIIRHDISTKIIDNIIQPFFDPLGAEYIRIPAGEFIYSRTDKPEKVDECYFAKYTVTNQQYRRFISYLEGKEVDFVKRLDVKTYENQLLQMASGIEGFRGYLDEEKGKPLASRLLSSFDDDKRFNKDDQPVVGVSWYAARAYCLWLSLLASNGEKTALYRLPTEIQWEWAAGGQRDKPEKILEVREYPWNSGEEISPQHANYDGNEGATTPVGRYPKGATPEGLYDMAGNVWEWMDSWWDENTRSNRVLRGGGWGYDARHCRSANRSGGIPDNRFSGVGFRLVFVP